MAEIKHKRGDSFRLSASVKTGADGVAIDITGWTIRSQLRKPDATLIDTLSVSYIAPTGGSFEIYSDNSSIWPTGVAVMDIEYTDGAGKIFSTETIQVRIMGDVTI